METSLLLTLLLAPLAGFLFNIFFGKAAGKTISGAVGTLAVSVSFVATLILFLQVLDTKQAIEVSFFEWINFSSFTIDFGFLLDQLFS